MTCPKVIRPKVTRPKVTRPKVTRPKWPIQKWALRNPAYRRHRISQPMRIEAQIQKQTYKDLLPPKTQHTAYGTRDTANGKKKNIFLYFLFCFTWHTAWPSSALAPPSLAPLAPSGGLTNERPWTDHLVWGPIRGIEKIAWGGDNRYTSDGHHDY